MLSPEDKCSLLRQLLSLCSNALKHDILKVVFESFLAGELDLQSFADHMGQGAQVQQTIGMTHEPPTRSS